MKRMNDNRHVKINLECLRDWLTNNHRGTFTLFLNIRMMMFLTLVRIETSKEIAVRDDTEDKNSCGRFVENRVFVVAAGIGYSARHANDRHIG